MADAERIKVRRKKRNAFGGRYVRSYLLDRGAVIDERTGKEWPSKKVLDGDIWHMVKACLMK